MKNFIDQTGLYHFLNWMELNDAYYIWLEYQGQSFNCLLPIGTQDLKDFIDNYKPKIVLKNDIALDGQRRTKITHVFLGRTLRVHYVLINTATLESNDTSGWTTVHLKDADGNTTEDGSQATKTCIDFEPSFDYEIYGGGLQTMEPMEDNFYGSAILLPDIPESLGGSVCSIRNKLLKQPKEDIFIAGFGTVELKYNEEQHTNKVRIQIDHPAGDTHKFQIEIQYYA